MKWMIAAAVVVTAVAGCGSQRPAPSPMLSDSFVRVTQVETQIDSGLAQQINDQTGGSYSVSSSCVATTETTFQCSAAVENDDDPTDYTQVAVDVSCDAEGANCSWRTA